MILFWILVAVFFIATLILAFVYGKSTIKDKPRQALVFVKTGLHINKPYKAKLKVSSKRGVIYKFEHHKKIVFIPADYGEYYYCNKRMIFLNRLGQLIASPFNKDKSLADTEKEDLIYELVESHVGADGMRALKGTKAGNVILIAVVAFIVGAVAVYGFTTFQDTIAVKQSPPTQQQQIESEVK